MNANYPSGIVQPFAGSSAPANFLLCDGASYLRADYPNLFNAIGTTYGAADGTHFNVPDCRARMIFGYDSADTAHDALGETGGVETINLQHSHTANSHTHSGSGTSSASGGNNPGTSSSTTVAAASHTHSVTVNTGSQTATGSDNQLSTTQSILNPYITLHFIIKI